MSTLENLLRMQVSKLPNGTILRDKHGFVIAFTPEFRVAVQSITEDGVHVIIHANGHDSDTVDLLIKNNDVSVIGSK